MNLSPKMLIICLCGVFVHCNRVSFDSGSVIETSGVLAVERNRRTPTHAQMLITIVCIYRSFMPLNASKGFSAPSSAVSDSLTAFTEI